MSESSDLQEHETPTPDESDEARSPMDPPQEEDEQDPEGPAFTHTPNTIYRYEGDTATQHPVLGLIEPGARQWATEDPVIAEALEACVASGLLIPKTSEASPE